MSGWVFWALLGAVIGYAAAQRSGSNTTQGLIIGALLGPLSLLMFLAKPSQSAATRKCPHCYAWMPAAATVCQTCKRDAPLPEPAAAAPVARQNPYAQPKR